MEDPIDTLLEHYNPDHKTFFNPWKSFTPAKKNFLWAFLTEWRKVSIPTEEELNKILPVVAPNAELIHSKQKPNKAIVATWIGHATFLLQFDGINVVTDPIFSERCSPSQWVGPKRIRPVPIDVTKLPEIIDVVVISHNHYDHTDINTIHSLKERVLKWYVPMGIKNILLDCNVPDNRIIELDWWGEHDVKENNKEFKVVCTPCQHFSGRTLLDRNETLWSSWVVAGPNNRIYFAGDTGYNSIPPNLPEENELKENFPVCPAFAQIGKKYGPFDLSCIPIGAYSPRWQMSPVHLNPMDAVRVHLDIKSKQSIAMHWGTFILTDEPILEPPEKLTHYLKQFNVPEDDFIVLKHGETKTFNKKL